MNLFLELAYSSSGRFHDVTELVRNGTIHAAAVHTWNTYWYLQNLPMHHNLLFAVFKLINYGSEILIFFNIAQKLEKPKLLNDLINVFIHDIRRRNPIAKQPTMHKCNHDSCLNINSFKFYLIIIQRFTCNTKWNWDKFKVLLNRTQVVTFLYFHNWLRRNHHSLRTFFLNFTFNCIKMTRK